MGDNLFFSNAKKLSVNKTTVLAVGFGLHNAWVCTTMYSTNTVFSTYFNLPGLRGGSFTLLYLVSVVAFSLAAFAAASNDQKLVKVARSRKVMLIAALATCIGTLLALAPNFAPEYSIVFECCSGAITGFGSVVLMMYWGIAFARERSSVIAIAGSIAVVLGFSLNTVVIQSIPTPFGGIVSALIPLAELFLLAKISPQPQELVGHIFNALPSNRIKLGAQLIGPIFLIGFSLSMLKHVSVQTTLESVSGETLIMLLLAGSLTISLFVVYHILHHSGQWDVFLRVIVPVLACASLAISLLVTGNNILSNLFLLISYIFIETLMWVSYAHLSHKFHLSPILIFGLSRGILTLSMFVGALVSPYIDNWINLYNSGNAVPIIIITFILIALGYALMPREYDIVKNIIQCPAVRFVSHTLEDELGLFKTEQASATFNTSPPSQAAHYSASDTDASRPKDTTSLSDARKAMLPTQENEVKVSEGKFTRKVKKVARMYLLTERETDILFELAKGNSPAYIQSKYFISAGTVKTHIRNVYRKLDIHKRNDLLRMIENTDSNE